MKQKGQKNKKRPKKLKTEKLQKDVQQQKGK